MTWNLLTLQKMLAILTSVCNSYLCSINHEIISNNMEIDYSWVAYLVYEDPIILMLVKN